MAVHTISHYRILKKIGHGGMGVVYKALDVKLDRVVAIKFLPSQFKTDDSRKNRFIQEARAASALDHPNICTIFEINETDDGQMYIVMACYSGETLEQKIKTRQLDFIDTVKIARQIANGLFQAHKKGIIHCDIKPANIFITDECVVKILDFGVARLVSKDKIESSGPQLWAGTLPYCSPEEVMGEKVDHQTDIWALGVLFYQMTTWQLPFEDKYDNAYIYSILNLSPIKPTELRADIPGDLDKIILKCLQKKRTNRYSSLKFFIKDLNGVQEQLESAGELNLPQTIDQTFTKKEPERRQATVLFVELSGYHELLKELDAEEAAGIINRYMQHFGEIIEKYGGKIDQISENGISALFGVPTAIEDAPREAINSAIEMRNCFFQLPNPQKTSHMLDIRIGINTGIVIAGARSTGHKTEYTASGYAVVSASQIKDICPQGEIYVGEATYRYTKNEFNYQPITTAIRTAKTLPQKIYQLLSMHEKIHRPEFGTGRMIHSKMVGRDNEFDLLKSSLTKLVDGHGSLLSIIGEAGIGKSRLISELKEIVTVYEVLLIEGRALSIGRNLSYHPIIDCLKSWAQINEDDSESVSYQKIDKAINLVCSDNFVEIFPFIATLMGIKLKGKFAERLRGIEGEALEKLILKNFRELLVRISTASPLILIFEDLHWADASSIEMIRSILVLVRTNRILIVCVLRPGYADSGDQITDTIREQYSDKYTEIRLNPLQEEIIDELIKNLLDIKALPQPLRQKISHRSGGNPFFIEEVARSLIDEGAIIVTNGKFEVTQKIDTMTIPETIQDVIMSRIDRLDESTRSLLKLASVIGRSFFYRIISEVGKMVKDIDDRLTYLQEIQLIIERERMEELEYLFKHALAQEAAYNSILVQKRKELHLKVADSIEKVFKNKLHEFYGMLAYHYSKGEGLDKAEEYLIKAGEEALKSSASIEALHYYQDALKLYLHKYGDKASLEKVAMLEKNIAIALFNKGRYTEAVDFFNRVLAFYGEKESSFLPVTLIKFSYSFLVFVFSLYFPFLRFKKSPTQNINEILDLFHKKCTCLAIPDPVRFFVDSVYSLRIFSNYDLTKCENGINLFSGGSVIFSWPGISFRISRKVLDYCRYKVKQEDMKSVLAYDFPELIWNFLSGNWHDAKPYKPSLVDANLKYGDIMFSSTYLSFHTRLAIEKGHIGQASALIQKITEIGDTYEHEYPKTYKYILNCLLLLKTGQFYQACKEAEDGIHFVERLKWGVLSFVLYTFKAKAQILQNKIRAASDTMETLKDLYPEVKLVPLYLANYLLCKLLFNLNGVSLVRPEHDTFKTCLKIGQRALKTARYVASEQTEAYRLIGTSYWAAGKQKKAVIFWRKSIKTGTLLGAVPELSRTYEEIGNRLLEKKSSYNSLNGLSASEHLEHSAKLFTEMMHH